MHAPVTPDIMGSMVARALFVRLGPTLCVVNQRALTAQRGDSEALLDSPRPRVQPHALPIAFVLHRPRRLNRALRIQPVCLEAWLPQIAYAKQVMRARLVLLAALAFGKASTARVCVRLACLTPTQAL